MRLYSAAACPSGARTHRVLSPSSGPHARVRVRPPVRLPSGSWPRALPRVPGRNPLRGACGGGGERQRDALLSGPRGLAQPKVVSEPLIQRQVTDLCEATTYIRLGEHLPCAWAEGKFGPALTTPCGDACQLRIRMLRKLDGCEVPGALGFGWHLS